MVDAAMVLVAAAAFFVGLFYQSLYFASAAR